MASGVRVIMRGCVGIYGVCRVVRGKDLCVRVSRYNGELHGTDKLALKKHVTISLYEGF